MTKEELKEVVSVPEVLQRYGVHIKGGRCRAICHDGKRLTAKVSSQLYFCFKCDKAMDIFDIVQHFEHCDFYTAFLLLGGEEKPTFRTRVKTNQAKAKREAARKREQDKKDKLTRINLFIDTYRKIIREEERAGNVYSDLWSYCQHKLQYQIYLQEYHTEKR